MKPEEHLQRIRQRCVELLALAEKRTPGKWTHRQGEYCSHWISRADNLSNIAEIPTASNYTAPEVSENACFISSCAGSAEAGWRSTIASVDMLLELSRHLDVQRSHVNLLCNAIIAAWPEHAL